MGLREEAIEEEHLAEEHERHRQRLIAGRTLAALRRGRGVSVRDLVWHAAVSRGYIWHIENGLVRDPDPRKLVRIAEVLGADPVDICAFFGVLPPDVSQWVRWNVARAARLLRPHIERGGSHG